MDQIRAGTPAYLKQSQVIPGLVPFSRATLRKKIEAGEFPAPIKMSERISVWRSEDVYAWLRSRESSSGRQIANRSAEAAAVA